MVNIWCLVYGHEYKNGVCKKCGKEGGSTIIEKV